jgi:DNA-binding beta-propeller fold protein YncE
MLLLAGCGGDTSVFSDPTGTPTASPAATTSPSPSPSASPATESGELLILADSTASHVTLLDPQTGAIEGRIEVGASPWRIAVHERLGYVTTASGLAIMDIRSGDVFGNLPFQSPIQPGGTGEFREGGMGIALSPDGTRAYVGVYTSSGSFLEVFHTTRGYERSIAIGNRPFDVVINEAGTTVYSIDHDSYTLTAVDVASWQTRTIEVAPLGQGAFDKPHYGVVAGGELLMPYQGRTLLAYNLDTGAARQVPLTSDTHQHGVALSPDGETLAIEGAGPAGEATGQPSLTLVDLGDGSERIIPLTRPHELVAFSLDGTRAYLTGGYLLDGGWEGVSVVDLESGAVREIVTPARPLGIVVLGPPDEG